MSRYRFFTPSQVPVIACTLWIALFIGPLKAVGGELSEGERPPGETPVIALVPVPEPPLEHLEKAVGDQLREAKGLILAAARSPEATPQQRAQAYLELGQMYHAYELNDSAEACYRNAITLDPSHMEWNYNLGYLFLSVGRYSEAVECFQRALATQPKSYLLFVRIGECYRHLNRPDLAKEAFETAHQLNPEGPAAMARLGEIALEEKRYEDAVRFLESALASQPAANKLHYPLAMAYRGLKDMERARYHLSKRGMVGIQPPDPLKDRLEALVTGYRVHTLSGRLAYSASRFVEASEEFQKAVEADPENAGARVNLGVSLARQKRYHEAIVQFQEAVRIKPEDVTAHFDLGSLLVHVGEYEKAIEHLRFVTERKPDDPQAHLTLANALRNKGQFGEAFEQYKAAVRLDPSQTSTWLEMSTLLSLAGQHREALQVLEAAHRRMPRDGPVAHALARLLAASPDASVRDGQRAITLAEKVYAAQPLSVYARTLAMAYAEAGQCIKAVEWQERAIDLAIASQTGKSVLDVLYRNLVHFKTERPCRVPAGETTSGR